MTAPDVDDERRLGRIRRAGRWVRYHWRTPALCISLVACVVLGFLQGEDSATNRSQSEDIAGVVARLSDLVEEQAKFRIDQGLASCQRGNELRSELRATLDEIRPAFPGINRLIDEQSFADVPCNQTIPGGTAPPTITPPTTEATP